MLNSDTGLKWIFERPSLREIDFGRVIVFEYMTKVGCGEIPVSNPMSKKSSSVVSYVTNCFELTTSEGKEPNFCLIPKRILTSEDVAIWLNSADAPSLKSASSLQSRTNLKLASHKASSLQGVSIANKNK